MREWEKTFSIKMSELAGQDAAHDFLHFQRVVNTAKKLCVGQKANLNIVIPAAWLHDFVIVSKDDPLRSQASRLAATAAIEYLESIGYPATYFSGISHAIESHSFSANIPPETIEAKIVQDADRLDALGAIGIARCFITGGILNRPIYCADDPFCETRPPEDQQYTVDHFFQKLFLIADTLQTAAGRAEGERRKELMKEFMHHMKNEVSSLE